MDEQEKQELIDDLRRLRDAHDAILANKSPPHELAVLHYALSVKTVVALDSALIALST